MYRFVPRSQIDVQWRLQRFWVVVIAASMLGAVHAGINLPPAAVSSAHPVVVLLLLAGLSAALVLFPLFFVLLPFRYSLYGFAGCAAVLGLLWVISPALFSLLFSMLAVLALPLYGTLLFLIIPCENHLDQQPVAGKEDLDAVARSLELDKTHFLHSTLRLVSAFFWALAGGLLARGLFAASGPETVPAVLSSINFFLPLALISFWAFRYRTSCANENDQAPVLAEPLPWPWGLPNPVGLPRFDGRSLSTFLFGPATKLALIVLVVLLPTGAVRDMLATESQLLNRMELLLGSRPRPLEFAVGYPLALLGLYLKGRPEPGQTGRLAKVFSATGVLALLSLSGAFIRPELSIPSAFWGGVHSLWLGLVLGFALLFTWKRFKFLLLLYRLYQHMEEQKKKGKKKPGKE